jgi:hypothetical protein
MGDTTGITGCTIGAGAMGVAGAWYATGASKDEEALMLRTTLPIPAAAPITRMVTAPTRPILYPSGVNREYI